MKIRMPVPVIMKSAANMRGILQLVAGLEDAVGEPGLDAARAGDELGDHRADQREAAADAQAPEEVGQGARQPQVPEHLAPREAP